MDIIKFLGAFGFGAVCVKLIDLIWLQPFLEKKEIRSWVRDRKLIAFSKVTENFQSIGLSESDECLFKSRAIICEAQLLIGDENLCDRMSAHVEKRYQLSQMEEETQECQVLFKEIHDESNEIAVQLKADIRSASA